MVIVGNGECDFDNPNIIFSKEGCSARIIFEEFLKEKNIRYLNTLEFSSIETIKACVSNGLGISLLPLYAIEDRLKDNTIKVLEESNEIINFKTQMIYHKNKSISVPMEKFIEVVKLEESILCQ